jgi:hypothetical protein
MEDVAGDRFRYKDTSDEDRRVDDYTPSKGLNFLFVFVGMEEDLFPSAMSMSKK